MTTDNRGRHPSLWKEPPLPGMATCLTVQMNATYYRSERSCRWVAIVRDPDANVELGRVIGLTRADDQAAMDQLFADLGQVLQLVDYQLHGTLDDLKQELAEEPPPPGDLPPPRKRRSSSATA